MTASISLPDLKKALILADKEGNTRDAEIISAYIAKHPDYNKQQITENMTDYNTTGRYAENEPGFFQKAGAAVKEMITGDKRKTESTENSSPLINMPEIKNDLFSTFASLFTDEKELEKIMKTRYPDMQTREDEKGNLIFISEDGREYTNKPGFSRSDIPRIIANALAFSRAGKAEKLRGRMLGSAGTQAAIEAGQAQLGGEANLSDVAMAAAMEPVSDAVAAVPGAVKKGIGHIKTSLDKISDPAIKEAANTEYYGAAEFGEKARSAAKSKFFRDREISKLTEELPIDKAVYDDAQRLGIIDHLQPDHLTTNQAYKSFSQAIKSLPGSKSKQLEIEGLEKIAEKANDIINDLGGTDDFSTLGYDVKREMFSTIKSLEKTADDLYRELDSVVDPKMKVLPEKTLEFIRNRADKLGGVDNLSSIERNLYRKLSPEQLQKNIDLSSIPDSENIPYIKTDLENSILGTRGKYDSKKQTFPDWWKSEIGWTRQDIYNVFDKIENGKKLTDIQENLYRDVMDSYKKGNDYQYVKYLKSDDIKKHVKNIDPEYLKELEKNIEEKKIILDFINAEEGTEYTIEELNDVIKDATGIKSPIQKIIEETPRFKSGKEIIDVNPNYALLDSLAKDLTEAKFKNKGPFRNASSGLIKKLESLLVEDQEKAVSDIGYGDLFRAARQSVAIRKSIENDIKAIFGKNIDKSIVTPLTSAIKNLPSGDVDNFINFVNKIPEDMRQSVVASGLSVALGKQAKNGQISFKGFSDYWMNLKKNKRAYAAIMNNLPTESKGLLDSYARISEAITNTSRFIGTGRINAIEKAMNGAGGLISKILSSGAFQRGAITGSLAINPQLAGLIAITKAIVPGSNKGILQLSDELISSDAFIRSMKKIPINEDAAVNDLLKSKQFRKFKNVVGKFDSELKEDPKKWIRSALQVGREFKEENENDR